MPLLRNLHFDFNPLNLDDQKSEAIVTLKSLMKDPDTDTQVISVLEPNLTSADFIAEKMRKLSDVARVTTLSNLVPDDQDQKLQIIAQAKRSLGPALDPSRALDPPTDEESVESIQRSASAFANTAKGKEGQGADAARRFGKLANDLANGQARRARPAPPRGAGPAAQDHHPVRCARHARRFEGDDRRLDPLQLEGPLHQPGDRASPRRGRRPAGDPNDNDEHGHLRPSR